VQELNKQRLVESADRSTWAEKTFATLFPGTPAVNALLATLYISGPPNFLLALCPPNIDPSSLSVMVAFAVGGLMGDTLFHLLPEIFLGEDSPEHVSFVMVEPKRNLLLGVAIMIGFMTFVAMDKALRIATGGGGHDHSHGHSHGTETKAVTTGSDASKSGSVKNRKGKKEQNGKPAVAEKSEASSSIKLGAFLNLIADFTHNITDGLAMSAAFYTSPTIGATTTMAVFFHEIPHEVGDFALLVQSGFSKRAAMGAQFVTAVGAVLGTLIGIAVQEGSIAAAEGAAEAGLTAGIFGTTLQYGDLLLPFTAGTFLYVGTVAVIPEMLEVEKGESKLVSFRKMATQFLAVAAGAGIMLVISW
jgi:solute carrier family 39 (zinc transporter), member 7